LLLAGIVALLLGGPILAQDDSKAEGKSRADRLKAVRDEGTQASMEYRRALGAAKTDPEKRAAASTYSKSLNTLRPKQVREALAIAKENPKDDVGYDALVLAFQLAPMNVPERAEARQLLIEHHLANEKIEASLPLLARDGRKFDKALVQQVKEKNPSKSVKAYAAYLLAQAQRAEAEGAETPDDQIVPRLQQAQKALEAVAQEYGDVEVKALRGKVGTAVQTLIADIKKSPIGKTTQEIEAEDLDGKKFKLSDYRGKVVLLDFWGHW